MTDRHPRLDPDHEAVLFALDCAYGIPCTALAADAIAGAADATRHKPPPTSESRRFPSRGAPARVVTLSD